MDNGEVWYKLALKNGSISLIKKALWGIIYHRFSLEHSIDTTTNELE